MTQTVIVILIVSVAVGWAVYRLVRTLRGRGGCSCGCSGCPASKDGGTCHCADGKKCVHRAIK